MKFTVVGIGHVGLSIATLLAQHHDVVALDIIEEKVAMINNRISPIRDAEVEDFLKNKKLSLVATTNKEEAFKDARFIVICVPTDYDEKTNYFDTTLVEKYVEIISNDYPTATIIIKSTVPIGFTNKMKLKYKLENIIYVPDFSREEESLYDNLYPSRIIIGDSTDKAKAFSEILKTIHTHQVFS